MLFAYRLTKGDRGQKGERNNNHYFVGLGSYAFIGEPPPYFFASQ